MFLLGFPFNYSQDTYEDMHYKNSILPFASSTIILFGIYSILKDKVTVIMKLLNLRLIVIKKDLNQSKMLNH